MFFFLPLMVNKSFIYNIVSAGDYQFEILLSEAETRLVTYSWIARQG